MPSRQNKNIFIGHFYLSARRLGVRQENGGQTTPLLPLEMWIYSGIPAARDPVTPILRKCILSSKPRADLRVRIRAPTNDLITDHHAVPGEKLDVTVPDVQEIKFPLEMKGFRSQWQPCRSPSAAAKVDIGWPLPAGNADIREYCDAMPETPAQHSPPPARSVRPRGMPPVARVRDTGPVLTPRARSSAKRAVQGLPDPGCL